MTKKFAFTEQFVSRENEIDILQHRAGQVIERKSGWVTFIRGEFGDGKSTLLDHFIKTLKLKYPTDSSIEEKIYITSFKCHENSNPSQNWIFSNILYDLAVQDAGKTQGVIRWIVPIIKAVPTYADILTNGILTTTQKTLTIFLAAPFTQAKASSQDTFFDFYSSTLKKLSQKGTLIIAIDDAQLADASAINLLFFLIKNTVGYPIYFILTYRPYEALSDYQGLFNKQRVEVLHTKADEISIENGISVSRFLEDEFRLPRRLVNKIQKYTNGHPENIEFLLDQWVIEGYLIKAVSGKFVVKDKATVNQLPYMDARADIWGIRISGMPKNCQTVLNYAAILGIAGDLFTFEPLHKMLGIEREELIDILTVLEKKYFLIENLEDRELFDILPEIPNFQKGSVDNYRFCRHCVPEYIRDEVLSKQHKKELHRKAMDVLISLYPDITPFAMQMYYHAVGAGDHFTAAENAHRVACLEATRFSWPEAIKWCVAGLNEIEKYSTSLDPDMSCVMTQKQNLREMYAIAAFYNDEYKTSEKLFELFIRDGAERGINVLRLANACNYLAYLAYYLNRISRIKKHAENGAAYLKDHPEITPIHVDNLIAQSMIYYYKDDFETYKDFLNRAVDLSKNLTPSDQVEGLLADAYNFLGIAYSTIGDYRSTLLAYESAISIDRKFYNIRAEAMHVLNIADAALMWGDIDNAIEPLDAGFQLAKSIEDGGNLSYAHWNRGRLWLLQGEYEQSLTDFTEAIRLAEEYDQSWLIGDIYARRAECYLHLHRITCAKSDLDVALRLMDDGDPQDICFVQYVSAKVAEAEGKMEDAHETFRKLIKRCSPKYKLDYAYYHLAYAEFINKHGKNSVALEHARKAYNIYSKHQSKFFSEKAAQRIGMIQAMEHENN